MYYFTTVDGLVFTHPLYNIATVELHTHRTRVKRRAVNMVPTQDDTSVYQTGIVDCIHTAIQAVCARLRSVNVLTGSVTQSSGNYP